MAVRDLPSSLRHISTSVVLKLKLSLTQSVHVHGIGL